MTDLNPEIFHIVFSETFHGNTDFFDSSGISNRESIEAGCHHPNTPEDEKLYRDYGSGHGIAIGMLFTGALDIQIGTRGGLKISYTFKGNTYHHASEADLNRPGRRRWFKEGVEVGQAAPLLVMLESLLGLSEQYVHTQLALRGLAALTNYPVEAEALRIAPKENIEVKHQVMRIADCNFQELHDSIILGEEKISLVDEMENDETFRPVPTNQLSAALGLTKAGGNDSGNNYVRLQRAFKRGANALLVGPPATLKTSSINRLAVDQQCWMVSMRGTPSVEDRDFIGAIMPSEHGARWVDGPLARAFTYGSKAKGIVKIDEVLRYEPGAFNALITALDELTYEDAYRVLEPPLRLQGEDLLNSEVRQNLFGDAAALKKAVDDEIESIIKQNLPEQTSYYMLELPNGDILFAPVKNMCFFMTTNWGEDHAQVADNIDGAMRSRIQSVLEYLRPDPEVAQKIYAGVAGNNQQLIDFALQLDDQMYTELSDEECLLERSTDLRKIRAFLDEISACMEDGMLMPDAIIEATRTTLVSHVCPRDGRGNIDVAAHDRLMNIVESTMSSCGIK